VKRLLQRLRTALPGPEPITRRVMRAIDPDTLLRRSREMATAVHVGDDTILCRALTRYRLYVDARDVGFGVHVILDGAWEKGLTVLMARRIRDGMAVVDVGANHGYYTLLFAHLTGPTGRVAAVEPHPRTAALLRRSLSANGFDPWTEVFECAAVGQDGVRLGLHTPDGEPKNAHVNIDPAASADAPVSVPGARLDTLLAHWPRVDFIKIDVEGAEDACLDGGWSLIVRDRPTLVLEFNAFRSRDPAGLLDRLIQVYGEVGVITREGKVVEVSRQRLEDRENRQDWMLFCESKNQNIRQLS